MVELKDMVLERDVKIVERFTVEELDAYVGKGYFRFQCLDWAVRDYSCGMIYSDAEEAVEDGSTVLRGKSCVRNWRQLYNFMDSFGDGKYFAVLVFSGQWVENGHDGEDVVSPDKFLAAFNAAKVMALLEDEVQKYKENGWPLEDFWV